VTKKTQTSTSAQKSVRHDDVRHYNISTTRGTARKEAKVVADHANSARSMPGYSNFGGGGPFAPMASLIKRRS